MQIITHFVFHKFYFVKFSKKKKNVERFLSRLPGERGWLQVDTLKYQVFSTQSFPLITFTKSPSIKLQIFFKKIQSNPSHQVFDFLNCLSNPSSQVFDSPNCLQEVIFYYVTHQHLRCYLGNVEFHARPQKDKFHT